MIRKISFVMRRTTKKNHQSYHLHHWVTRRKKKTTLILHSNFFVKVASIIVNVYDNLPWQPSVVRWLSHSLLFWEWFNYIGCKHFLFLQRIRMIQINDKWVKMEFLNERAALIDGQLAEGSVHAEQIVGIAGAAWSQRFVGLGTLLLLEPLSVFLELVAPLFWNVTK